VVWERPQRPPICVCPHLCLAVPPQYEDHIIHGGVVYYYLLLTKLGSGRTPRVYLTTRAPRVYLTTSGFWVGCPPLGAVHEADPGVRRPHVPASARGTGGGGLVMREKVAFGWVRRNLEGGKGDLQ